MDKFTPHPYPHCRDAGQVKRSSPGLSPRWGRGNERKGQGERNSAGGPFPLGTPLGERRGGEARGEAGAGGASGAPPLPSPPLPLPAARSPACPRLAARPPPLLAAAPGAARARSPETRREAAGRPAGGGPGLSQRAASGPRFEADDVFASGSAGAKLGRAVTSPPGHVTPIQINKPPPPRRALGSAQNWDYKALPRAQLAADPGQEVRRDLRGRS